MTLRSDVVIIGGGVMGLCTAYYLSAQGASVTVLERGEIGRACSDRNAGLVVPSHIIPLAAPGMISKGLRWMFNPESPFYIKPRLSTELLSWAVRFWRATGTNYVRRSTQALNELLQASSLLFDDLEKNLNGFGLTRKGLLMLCRTQKGLAAERIDADTARQLGLEVSVLNNDDIHALEPGIRTAAVGGVYYHQDGHLNPTLLMDSLQTTLAQRSVLLKKGTAATGFEKTGGKIEALLTAKERIVADEFVLAGGAWSSAIARHLGQKLLLQAGKGYSVTVTPQTPSPSLPFILSEAKVAVTPMGQNLRFAGTMELSGIDERINQRRVQAMLKAIPLYFENFDQADLVSTDVWGGLRPCAPDGLPYIGRFRNVRNLTVATGHAMLGVTLAPITGKVVSDIIAGRAPAVDILPLSPDRFS